MSAPILACLLYFALLSLAQVGTQNFLPTLLPGTQAVTYAFAATATTIYLSGSAVGALVGGWLADRTRDHERIVGAGLLAAGILSLVLGLRAAAGGRAGAGGRARRLPDRHDDPLARHAGARRGAAGRDRQGVRLRLFRARHRRDRSPRL